MQNSQSILSHNVQACSQTEKTGKSGSELMRVPVAKWGCSSAQEEYQKLYKLGQGSYGFEF
jgi:hypothetical protein